MFSEGATFNLFFAHLIFWIFGFPAGEEYGYNDDNRHEDGHIPSGPSGSGIFVITLVLVIVATVIFLIRAGRIWINGRPETTEEIIRRKTTRRRTSITEEDDDMKELQRKASSHDVSQLEKTKNPYAKKDSTGSAGAAAEA